MESLRVERKNFLLLVASIFGLAALLGVLTLWHYSSRQLEDLGSQHVFKTPEEGTRAMISRHYSGVTKVEIVHANKEIFSDLWFVEAHVWSDRQTKTNRRKEYDNPGWFFVRVEGGWAFIPEGKFPHGIVLGKWLFGM